VFQPTASDANGDRLTFSASGVPTWARFDKKLGRLYGTPGPRNVGSRFTVSIRVTDGKLTTYLPRFYLTVVAASSGSVTPNNAPPTLSGTPAAAVTEGELYGFLPTASDPEGAPLQFSIQGRPSWATFTSSSGLLSGIPPAGSAGTYSNIRLSVSDGTSTVSMPAFAITVNPRPNSPPVISGIAPTRVDAGAAYAFRPSASDPDGQALRFGVVGLPSWAAFDTATGALTGTPTYASAGTHSGIAISVSDGIASTALAPFSITVVAANTPPTISGTPADSVQAGQAYGFTPSARDPEGQPLTFSIANKPAWASFDATTGRLAGTSTTAATHSGITLSVSDGEFSAALPAFSITVVPVTSGQATLRWSPPTTNVDGTPITNLAGYRIVYGTSAASLSSSLTIASAAITSAVIEGLSVGTWYFAVKAYTTANVESDLSPVASKTIN
jgi:hypothetical protein